jgi:hypothetical protein
MTQDISFNVVARENASRALRDASDAMDDLADTLLDSAATSAATSGGTVATVLPEGLTVGEPAILAAASVGGLSADTSVQS